MPRQPEILEYLLVVTGHYNSPISNSALMPLCFMFFSSGSTASFRHSFVLTIGVISVTETFSEREARYSIN